MDTIDLPVSHDRTAQRPGWDQLPDPRESNRASLDSPVSHVDVKYSGFSPDIAAVVHTADHRAHFVKAIHATSPWPTGTAPRPGSP